MLSVMARTVEPVGAIVFTHCSEMEFLSNITTERNMAIAPSRVLSGSVSPVHWS
jgi:hypothetical protein